MLKVPCLQSVGSSFTQCHLNISLPVVWMVSFCIGMPQPQRGPRIFPTREVRRCQVSRCFPLLLNGCSPYIFSWFSCFSVYLFCNKYLFCFLSVPIWSSICLSVSSFLSSFQIAVPSLFLILQSWEALSCILWPELIICNTCKEGEWEWWIAIDFFCIINSVALKHKTLHNYMKRANALLKLTVSDFRFMIP